MREHAKKIFLLSIGWLSFVAGMIGLLLPLIPTTPFLLLSAYCFSRSSKKLHRWLLNNRWFGSAIRQWEESHTMDPVIKRRALILTVIVFAISVTVAPVPAWGKIALALLGLGLCGYLMSIPVAVMPPQPKEHGQRDETP